MLIDKPRSFCFRGLEAKDESLLLYKITVDRGVNAESAMELYNEAMALEDEAGNYSTEVGFYGSQIKRVVSGFYLDRRHDIFKEAKGRVFLIINQGRTSGKCIVIRPNYGRCVYSKDYVQENLINGAAQLRRCTNIAQAVEMWSQEFDLADRPSTERYQRYCYGRHDESFVFSGKIIPILNKLLVASNPNGSISDIDMSHLTMPNIIRVDPSGKPQEPTVEGENSGLEDHDEAAGTEADARGENQAKSPAVGQKVAYEMLGSSVFRGIITKVSVACRLLLMPI